MSQDRSRFGFAKDHRESSWTANSLDAVDELEFAIEDLLVKEEQCVESLVLSGRGNVAIKCEMAEESCDLFFAHLLRVPFIVEEDEAANPIDIGLFGANAVAFDAEVPTDAVEEFGWRGAGRGRRIFCDAKGLIRLGDDREDNRGRLPPVVSWSRPCNWGRALAPSY